MRIAYHLGVHCTDEERLIRCLLKNRAPLAGDGIAVPSPTRYRRLLRDTAVQLKGRAASAETEAMVLEQILDDEEMPERMVLSWESFLSFPQWTLRGGQLYSFGGERIRAFTRIFPGHTAEFHLGLRNIATFLPALFALQKGRTQEEFLAGTDLTALRWSEVVAQIQEQNPGVPVTVWCDEDTPLIWPEVLREVSGHSDAVVLEDAEDLLSGLLTPDGLGRMHDYLASHPPGSIAQRRRIVGAFLTKFTPPARMEMRFEMPGWTEDIVAGLSAAYDADVARIRGMPGVRVLSP